MPLSSPIRLPLGLGLAALGRRRGGAWSPALLFSGSEQGAWYDAADLSVLFQDTGATTPVTADGQTVALIVNKAGGGANATQATAGNRPIFREAGGVRYLEYPSARWLNAIANPKWLHDGTGGYLAIACQAGFVDDPNALFYICGTRGHSIVNGFTLGFDDRASSSFNNALYGAIQTKFAQRANNTLTANTPVLIEALIQSGTNGAQFFVNGSLAFQSNLTSPSTLDCTHPLQIGAGGANDIPMTGYVHGLITMNRIPTTQERAAVLGYFT
jgi:hypothetical protein